MSQPATPAASLAAYAAYLRERHLDSVATDNLRVSRELGVPLLRLFEHLAPEELEQLYRESTATFLADLEAGRALAVAAETLKAWERDELPHVPRDAVEPGDMVLVYAAQRRALQRHLADYATDPAVLVAVVQALDEHYTSVQREALQVFDRLRRAAAARQAAAEAAADEHQALAEELQSQQDELNRLYERLNTQHQQLEADFAERTRDLRAANEELTAQSEELEAQQAELQRVHEALAEQVRFQSGLLDNIPGAVGYCDAQLVMRAVNEPYARMIGQPRDTFAGRHVAEIFPPDAVEKIEALRETLAAGGPPVRQVGVPGSLGPDGQATWYDHVVTGVRDGRGELVGILSLSVDATERVQLERTVASQSQEVERQRRLLERVTDRAPAGIALLDTDLVVRWANPEILRLFQRDAADFVNQPFLERASPEARTRFDAVLRGVIASGEPFQASGVPYRMRLGDAPRETFWDFSYVPVPDDDGATEGVLVFALEVTARVENERSHEERLEHLRQLDRMKDEFLAALSSQLATPINTVAGFASVLADGAVGGPLRPEHLPYARRILAMCQVQLALVDDLLDMGRISAGKFQLERDPIDMVALARGVLEGLEPLTSQQGQRVVTYMPEALPSPLADSARIERVLTNFVHAATKLTPPGGQIRVEVRRDGAELRLEVQDGGPPMSAEQVEQALARFTQLGGTWVGLSVSKHVIAAHGGTLGLAGHADVGNTYWFTLPLEEGV